MKTIKEQLADGIKLRGSLGRYDLNSAETNAKESIKMINHAETVVDDIAVKFAEWMGTPIYQSPNELGFRKRCIAMYPDYDSYSIIDETGYAIEYLGKRFLSLPEVYQVFKTEMGL